MYLARSDLPPLDPQMNVGSSSINANNNNFTHQDMQTKVAFSAPASPPNNSSINNNNNNNANTSPTLAPSSPTMPHSTTSSSDGDLLYEETRKGARESAAIAEFLRKRVKIEDEYARSLLQLCKSFPSGSNGSAIGEIFSNLIECTAKQAGSHLAAASQLAGDVTTPLKQFVDDLKVELKGVQQEAHKLAMERREVCDAFKRSKSNFESACKEADNDSDTTKMDEHEEEYKVHIKHVNTYLQTVYADKFQKIAMDLQRTEILRMHKMKVSLKRFVNVLEDLPQQSTIEYTNLSDKIGALDTKEEIKNFSSLVKVLNKDDEILFEPYERGPPKAKKEWRITMAIRTNSTHSIPAGDRNPRLEDKKARVPPPTAVFGVPLEVVMERQKGSHPELDVPYVVVALIELIKHLNGCKTEGIFRIPGVARETEGLKKRLDEGEEVESKMFPNIHTAASTLKLWLRELPNSLIPEDM